MKPCFINPDGFELLPVIGKPNLWEFKLDPVAPLTFRTRDGIYVQPDRHHFRRTDGGSIPRLVQLIPGFEATRFMRSYCGHDSGYQQHGRYESATVDGPFAFVARPRSYVDEDLHDGILTEHGNAAVADTIWGFVRTFGWVAWNRYQKSKLSP